MRRLPKRLAAPANGLTVEDEPDAEKAARLLGMFRYLTERNMWTVGVAVEGAQYMIIRYRPAPYGPHNPGANMEGIEL